MYTRQDIAKIISERDDMTVDEALIVVDDAITLCRGLLVTSNSPSEVKEAWIEETGLEIDYMIDVLY